MYRLLFFILLTPSTWANPNEMLSDKELEKKFVSIIKENEIVKLIEKTKDFNDCRKDNEFVKADTPEMRYKKAKTAQECFQNKFKDKSTKEIQKLSENLGLESYQLVKSKNIKDITEYLGQRMYTALTGISEKDQKNKIKLANMKFKDKKVIDQREFFKLYSYQLTKNALLEVSRFCFQNLTNTTKDDKGENPSTHTFHDHWKLFFNGTRNQENPSQVKTSKGEDITVSDDKTHHWGDLSESAEPNQAYEKIFSGMGNIDPQKLSHFWEFCTGHMKQMCDDYKPDSGSSRGANSCLAINRLRNIRNAISDTEKTEEYMNKEMVSGVSVGLDNGENARFFKVDKETTYDSLTNVSSMELLEKPDRKLNELIANCKEDASALDCDKFIAEKGTQSAELLHKIDQEMMLKQEAEIARIIQIKTDNKIPLDEYFRENGYFELADKGENVTKEEIREFLSRNYQAQRTAVTNRLKETVGSRQISDEQEDDSRSMAIKTAVSDTEQERARLAQVILFNNIITSNLSLINTKNEEVSKNVGAWKKESESLISNNIDQELFQNIQGVIDTSGGAAKNNSIKGTEFIDLIIGKAPKTEEAK